MLTRKEMTEQIEAEITKAGYGRGCYAFGSQPGYNFHYYIVFVSSVAFELAKQFEYVQVTRLVFRKHDDPEMLEIIGYQDRTAEGEGEVPVHWVTVTREPQC